MVPRSRSYSRKRREKKREGASARAVLNRALCWTSLPPMERKEQCSTVC
jgi:hypothetical protein